MFRPVGVIVVFVSLFAAQPAAAQWSLEGAQLIDASGTRPSLWAGTIAYTVGDGGALQYYDGTSVEVYGAIDANWEPQNANGMVGWRNNLAGETEILRWLAPTPGGETNVSNAPGSVDSSVSAGSNGDLIWSRDHTWLMYYDTSSGLTTPLGIRGESPSLYITADGVATYAYQDPDPPYEVKYFDGIITHTLGIGYTELGGPSLEADPSVWNGAVAWLGQGVADPFAGGEVYFWKDGQSQRLTNDDAVSGIADVDPCVWDDRVVWSRRVNGIFMPPVLYHWDGTNLAPLTVTGGEHPSFHRGQVAWTDDEGLHLASLAGGLGDCNDDGLINLDDFADLDACFLGPDEFVAPECECFDLDHNAFVDLGDYSLFQTLLTGP